MKRTITYFSLSSFPSTFPECKFSIEQFFLYLRFYFEHFISCRRNFLPAHDFHGDAWRSCIYSFAILIKHETHFRPGLPCNQNTAFPQSSPLDDGCGNWTSEEQRRKITDKMKGTLLPVFMVSVGKHTQNRTYSWPIADRIFLWHIWLEH